MSFKRVQIALAVVAALVVVGVFIASPWMAAARLSAALKSGDPVEIGRMVDFPSVRKSLASQLTAKITQEARNDPEAASNPFAGLVTLLAPTLVNQLVNVIVTPDGLAKLSREAQKADAEADARRRADGKKHRDRASDAKPVLAYTGLNSFTATYDSRSKGKMVWTMGREHLFFWKLKKIEVSEIVLDDIGGHGEDDRAPSDPGSDPLP